MTPTPTIPIKERNESKYLIAVGFKGVPIPRNPQFIDFHFEATDELFEARRSYSLNHHVPILSFIAASEYVDNIIAEHRRRSYAGGAK